MKTRTLFLTMTALVLASACSRGGTDDNISAADPAANAAAPAAGNEHAGIGNAVDAAFLTGRWGTDGSCAKSIEFRADGTVTPPEGSSYAVSGNVVTVASPGRPPDPKTVTRTGDDSMTVTGGGSTTALTRCK